jgi:OmpA-OmpF porin, OOP family
MFKKTLQKILFFTAVITSNASFAEEVTNSIVEFSPSVGYFSFDSKRNLDDKVFGGMGLGLHFSRSFAALLHYSRLESDFSGASGSANIDIQKYHIDGMYFFNAESRWRPYVVFGYGQIDFDNDKGNDSDENNVNSGVGLYYRVTPKWSLRADVRNFYSLDENYNDQTFMMSVGYRVGEGERGK